MIVVNRFASSMLMASVAFFPSYLLSVGAEVNSATVVRNGLAGNFAGSAGTLTITKGGSITVSETSAVSYTMLKGGVTTVENDGKLVATTAVNSIRGIFVRGIATVAAVDVTADITNFGEIEASSSGAGSVRGIHFAGEGTLNNSGSIMFLGA